MEDYLDFYCRDEQRELKKLAYPLIVRFGGISQKDHDDFYSLASFTLFQALKSYSAEKGIPFAQYLRNCIARKFDTYMTKINRRKRACDRLSDSLETPIGEEGMVLGDILVSDFDMDMVVSENTGEIYGENAERYLGSLTNVQRKIVEMRMDHVPVSVIREKLGLTGKRYESYMKIIRSYEHTKHLFREKQDTPYIQKGEFATMETIVTTTSEKTKNTSYAVSAISKKLRKYQLRDDHVLQRTSGQWNNLYKSELISDILQGKSLTQIIVSEEIKNGVTMYWLIDGKQRCTNLDDFLNDGFAISKNVQRYEIQYQTCRKDENGNDVLNEDGFPIPENKVFDIRNKKFSQLPEELRDKFEEFQVPVMLNLNCTKKEIAYDIARFNRCRPMTVAQNGWTGLEEEFAEYVDHILKMNFFREDSGISSYRQSSMKSGMMRRMIVESIMAVNYLDDFNKDFRKMCEFLSEEANDSTFIEFYALIERLSSVSNREIADVFNIRDSFLWFGLFSRFEKLGLADEKFAEFVLQFKQKLHRKEVKGVTYDALNEKSTKDKNIVIRKIDHLETLMKEYFGIGDTGADEPDLMGFVRENVDSEITQEDLEQYGEVLDQLMLRVNPASKLADAKNRPSLVALVAYSFKKDLDLDDWVVGFFDKNHQYLRDQRANLANMKRDLELFLSTSVGLST